MLGAGFLKEDKVCVLNDIIIIRGKILSVILSSIYIINI